jgi:hypothetical protein
MKPNIGDTYYIPLICAQGNIKSKIWGDSEIDNILFLQGKVFTNRIEAKKYSREKFYELKK